MTIVAILALSMPADGDQHVSGFLAGQATALCEQIRLGNRLAAQVTFPIQYLTGLLGMVEKEGCKAAVEQIDSCRVSLWIYRESTTKRLIDALQSAPASDIGIWAMGKLFGYADHEVIAFIERSTSISPEESNLRLGLDIACSNKERGCSSC